MVSDPVAQWAFTILFLATASYLASLLLDFRRRRLEAIGAALHLVMALDMAAMAWPWWSSIPALPQLLFFVAASLWYLVVFAGQISGRVSDMSVGGHGAWFQVVHLVMMLAMVWMVLVMWPGSGGNHTTSHGGHTFQMSTASNLTGVLVTAALIIAGTVLAANHTQERRAVGSASEARRWVHLVEAAMCVGMAAMAWAMIGP